VAVKAWLHWIAPKGIHVSTDIQLMSDRQYEVITLLALGMTDETVARRLDVSPRTVQRHVSQVMEQLGVRSRLELGIRLTKMGVL
jgi:DNA-binding NarL/FixJ family response regulator